ncbi:MAG: hypothetical protein ACL93V_17170 [Candidatus Electrothrix sp. YB6]
MKEQQHGTAPVKQQEETEGIVQKQPYEKPRLDRVKLFADQVLASCSGGAMAPPCGIFDPLAS